MSYSCSLSLLVAACMSLYSVAFKCDWLCYCVLMVFVLSHCIRLYVPLFAGGF